MDGWEIIPALFHHTVMIEGRGKYGTNIDIERHWGETKNKITSKPETGAIVGAHRRLAE